MAPELARFESEQPNVAYQHVDMDERDSAVFKKYAPNYFKGRSIPFTVLVDSTGKARKEWVGVVPYNQLADQILVVAQMESQAK